MPGLKPAFTLSCEQKIYKKKKNQLEPSLMDVVSEAHFFGIALASGLAFAGHAVPAGGVGAAFTGGAAVATVGEENAGEGEGVASALGAAEGDSGRVEPRFEQPRVRLSGEPKFGTQIPTQVQTQV